MSEVVVTTQAQLNELISATVKQAVSEALRDRQLPILLSLKETAELLGVSQTTIHRAAKIQGFPVTNDFGHAKVVTDQLLQWIKNRSNYDLVYNFSG
ncbi:hypothetical protein SporoP37_00235 [Sporosarcina sp. P37]|uniref:helix-turn-helix domain-containing protein n=1 Tax=unclassified Sporosarcina TaxID=2647733 RepID=UPI000A179E46|nr:MULTISPECIES: helix-turn-helix domain-containing protein [unclassified Sporosarcina]ARK23269.1 hypothetical protein SporoP37_00235 [Sporosarcina sp. P37]PID19519.1 DNA-binding protein [Sporosarcina sp. P35]